MNSLVTLMLSLLLLHGATSSQEIDCIDAQRKLRCVIKDNCPIKLVEATKHCPFDRVCCRRYKSNPYLSLRITPYFRTTTPLPLIKNRIIHQDEDRFIFPSELEWIKKNRSTITTSIKIYNKHVRESKSELTVTNAAQEEVLIRKPRRSVLQCDLYEKISLEYLYFMPLLPEVIPEKITVDNCEPQLNPLIVGGDEASIKDYPHMAAIGFKKFEDIDYLCGGTLISENFILTAAHCANTRWGPPIVVHLGSSDLFSKDAVIVGVKEVIVHPQYKAPSCYNDIALLQLNQTITLSLFLRPACLPRPETELQAEKMVSVATGWGRTGFGRDSSLTLLKVPLKLVKNTDCNQYYEKDKKSEALKFGITSNMLCASGYRNKYQDTCQGDSGGPLQAHLIGHKCQTQVIGITSFGKSCGSGIPAVYTRVLPYLSWIEGIVWP